MISVKNKSDGDPITRNDELVNDILKCIETVNAANKISNEVKEEWIDIIIISTTLGKGSEFNMVEISASYMKKVYSAKSFPKARECLLNDFATEKEEVGTFDRYCVVKTLGRIRGKPDAFVRKLGELIKNRYPKLSFTSGEDGSDGYMIHINYNSSFERR
ncbi:MAG: hypothetical protein ACI4JY_12125 [Oscillospiraceae bacterium]